MNARGRPLQIQTDEDYRNTATVTPPAELVYSSSDGPQDIALPPTSSSTRASGPTVRRSRSLGAMPARQRFGPPQQIHLGGPIMFTAPHGLQVYRIGERGRPRVHQRERNSTEIALRLALAVGSMIQFVSLQKEGDDGQQLQQQQANNITKPPPRDKKQRVCSFCVWNCMTAKPLDEDNLDPNYLFAPMFNSSPWHSSLRAFKHHVEANLGTVKQQPLPPTLCEREHLIGAWWSSAAEGTLPPGTVPLHVDLHGKINRQGNFDLDVGVASMDYFFPASERILLLREVLERELTAAMLACPIELKGMPATVNMNPHLSGLWGLYEGVPHTMTTQAVLLGLHSLQLEIPYAMRTALMSTVNTGFFVAFATAIAKVFVALQPPAVQSQIVLREIPQSILDMKTGGGRSGSVSGAVGSPAVVSPQLAPSVPAGASAETKEVAASSMALLRETIMYYQTSDKKQI